MKLLERLRSDRPALAAAAQDPGAKAQLLRVDQRMVYLQQSLHTAVLVSPPAPAEDRVRFRLPSGEEELEIVAVGVGYE